MPADSLKKKTVSSLFWKFFERCGNSLTALVVQIVMARLLMPEDYGLLAIILVFINLGDIVVKSGFPSALVQTPEASEEDYSTVFWISFALSLVLFAIIFFIAPVIARFYQNENIVWPLRAMGILLIISAFNGVQTAKVARDLVFKKTFIATISSVVISGAFGIVLALAGAGLWSLVGQQLLYAVVNCIVLRTQVKWLPRPVFNAHRAKELFLFGWKLMAAGFISTTYQGLVNLVIGKQFSASDLGLLSQGEKIPSALGRLTDGTIQPVIMSAIAHVQEDRDYVRRLMRRAIRTSAFIIYPVMGCMLLVAQPLVHVLLGDQWLACVPYLQVECLIYAQLAIQSPCLQTLVGTGRSGVYLVLDMLNKALSLIAFVFTVFVLHNMLAYVIGGLVASIVSSLLDVLPHRKSIGYGVADLLKDTVPPAALTLIVGLLAYALVFTGFAPWIILLLQVIVMTAAYLGLAKLFRLEGFEYLVGILKDLSAKTK